MWLCCVLGWGTWDLHHCWRESHYSDVIWTSRRLKSPPLPDGFPTQRASNPDFFSFLDVIMAFGNHYDYVIMTMLASQITSLTVVYSIVYSGVNYSGVKHQSSASLAFVWEIHRGPVNFPHKWPVTRKMFPFDDVIMHIYSRHTWCTPTQTTMRFNQSVLRGLFSVNTGHWKLYTNLIGWIVNMEGTL